MTTSSVLPPEEFFHLMGNCTAFYNQTTDIRYKPSIHQLLSPPGQSTACSDDIFLVKFRTSHLIAGERHVRCDGRLEEKTVEIVRPICLNMLYMDDKAILQKKQYHDNIAYDNCVKKDQSRLVQKKTGNLLMLTSLRMIPFLSTFTSSARIFKANRTKSQLLPTAPFGIARSIQIPNISWWIEVPQWTLRVGYQFTATQH